MTDWMDTIDFTPASDISITTTYSMRGEGTATSSSAMIGQTIKTVTCSLATNSGTASAGTVHCEVRKMSDNSLVHTIGDNSTAVTTTPANHVFSSSAGHVIANGETICIRYDASSNELILRRSDGVSAYNTSDSCRSYYNGTSWAPPPVEGEDWLATFSDGFTPTGGGTVLPPPVAWVNV